MNEKEFKGLLGESLTERLISDNIKCYKQIIRDVIIEYEDKKTQIDNIVITSKGIFVIENKNYSGIIIFNNDDCIQILGNQKNYINNPINQNEYHIKILSKVLNIPFDSFKSYIVMGYDTNINNRSNNRNIINIQDLVRNILTDMCDSNDIFTHEEIDNIYLKIALLNKNNEL